ncbi:Isocitrate dehydrogenase [NADP] [subsurface metagenome]|nr:isocitrate/isopropylmalate dehydrogenase family protein [Clostridia bacterium]
MYKVTLIPGDGVGPEVVDAARKCIEATGVKINWEKVDAGADIMDKYGTPLPDKVIDSIKKNRIALKGPVTTPVGIGFRSVNVALRQKLDLYACLRPCKWYPGVRSRYEGVDLVVVRENTEDVYSGIEFEEGKPETSELINFIYASTNVKISDDSGISIKPISRHASERIIRFAFDYARKNNRKKVTGIHKANIMKYSDGIFVEVFHEVARDYPDIQSEDKIVDNMCMQLVQKPALYDVLVLPNLYGDIISDLCAGLVGGLGLAPGANIGEEIAVFEATHGSAPKYKGKNKVNPTAMILSGVLMLRHLGEEEKAERLENAVVRVIAKGETVTYDLGGTAKTSQMAKAIIKNLK